MSFWDYFFHPVFFHPLFATAAMAASCALMGTLLLLRRESLWGEVLSHSSYPGILSALLLGSFFSAQHQELWAFAGACISSALAAAGVSFLRSRKFLHEDASLCFVLSAFFSFGVLFASHLQFTNAALYKQAQAYLYGQTATITSVHLYASLGVLFLSFFFLFIFRKDLLLVSFDPTYARCVGVGISRFNLCFFSMLIISLVVSIYSMGLVLVSAMLVAPALGARQFTSSLWGMLFLSLIFALASSFVGMIFAHQASLALTEFFSRPLFLAGGPFIVCLSSLLCFFSLSFSPKRGWVLRAWRVFTFRRKCLYENLLKSFWYKPSRSYKDLLHDWQGRKLFLHLALRRLMRRSWIECSSEGLYFLTKEGQRRASHIVRLHRLWELYLVRCIGMGEERVHRSAEDIEHVLTAEMEKKLDSLLDHPHRDPHNQKIPPSR